MNAKEGGKQMNRCSICSGNIVDKKINVERWWQGRLIIIEGVPAHVCEQCGETYFDADIALEMERINQAVTVPGERLINVPVRPFIFLESTGS
jgi:YgiT-type zinc finger domain-containing protein